MGILSDWEISEEELTKLVHENPSMRGIMIGYVAEHKFHELFLTQDDIMEATKDDDHDRSHKGDRRITYKGLPILIEVKSLQTNTVSHADGDNWKGKTQVDASDCREVRLEDGSSLKTTCLKRGEFDILAVNCFAFGDKWRFVFALNEELPQNVYPKYTPEQKRQLLPTLIEVTWPPRPPFSDDFSQTLKRLIEKRKTTR